MTYIEAQTSLDLFPDAEKKVKQDYTSTFADNMSMPVHKWYRYTAGFSADWVRQLLREQKHLGRTKVIEPFAGSGTVLLECEFQNLSCFGVEAHPYIYRIARAKLNWQQNPTEFKSEALNLLERARKIEINKEEYPELIGKCYPPEVIKKLESLKQAFLQSQTSEIFMDFNWFIITSILRTCSPVGTAQWQYVLPNKKKSKIIDPYEAFESKVYEMYSDMRKMQSRFSNIQVKASILPEDARDIKSIPEGWGDLVITSPPYANNYDYADATRLELTFWGDVEKYSDLQKEVRQYLIRACTQHVNGLQKEIDNILANTRLEPIREELLEIYSTLAEERMKHGGKKNYHLMIAAYFQDLADVFFSLRKVMNKESLMCFVIGDSAPYGVYVPVEEWLGKLALHAGFKSYDFEKLRDRNIKWKNRKHRVPLKEGRLWIKG